MVRHRPLWYEFPSRLRLAREKKGLTAEQLAHAVGLKTRASISKMETGAQSVSLELTEKLADALGVRPAWLAYGDGEP